MPRAGTLSIDVNNGGVAALRNKDFEKFGSHASASMSTSANFGKSFKQARNEVNALNNQRITTSIVISQDGMQSSQHLGGKIPSEPNNPNNKSVFAISYDKKELSEKKYGFK